MINKITRDMLPEVINNYKAYSGETGENLIGVTTTVTLPEISHMTATISGAGLGGEFEVPVAGYTQNITMELPFTALTPQVAELSNSNKKCEIVLRAATQVFDKGNGTRDYAPMKIVVGGAVTAGTPGSLQLGNPMGSTLKISATRYSITVGDDKLFEVDKINQIYIVDGVDMMQAIRDCC